jgi:hypothetical protein
VDEDVARNASNRVCSQRGQVQRDEASVGWIDHLTEASSLRFVPLSASLLGTQPSARTTVLGEAYGWRVSFAEELVRTHLRKRSNIISFSRRARSFLLVTSQDSANLLLPSRRIDAGAAASTINP